MKPFSRNSDRCPNCQAKLSASTRFCGSCGAEQPAVADSDAKQPPECAAKKRPPWRRITAIAASLVLVLAIAGGATMKIKHDNQVKRERAAKLAEERRQVAKQHKLQAAYDECVQAESGLVDKLEEVDARLDVGMTYKDYSDDVSDVSVAYDQAAKNTDVELDCLTDVAVPAEAAVNHYIRAARRWNDCISDIDCDADSLDLQRYWSRAREKTDEASGGLIAMKP